MRLKIIVTLSVLAGAILAWNLHHIFLDVYKRQRPSGASDSCSKPWNTALRRTAVSRWASIVW